MKNNKLKIYAKALAEVILEAGRHPMSIQKDRHRVSINFVKMLEKQGLQAKAKEILGLTQDILLKNKGNKKIIFETARQLTTENKNLLKHFIKKGDVVQEKVNPELLAGIKVIVDGKKQFDNSMLNKINNLL